MLAYQEHRLEEKREFLDRQITEMEEEITGKGYKLIPRYFALASTKNHKYLRYLTDDDKFDGFLQFSRDLVVSPYTKFNAEESIAWKGFFHIKCCYNNKYWVRRSSDSNFIVAAADEAEEDVSKWSCTLFEPIHDVEREEYRFRHVQLDYDLSESDSSAKYSYCLFIKTPSRFGIAFSKVLDWDSMFILPKHVAFKGDNGNYLRRDGYYEKYLEFSGSNLKDTSISHEIFPAKDGFIRIKHEASNKFWIYDPDWIHAKASEAKIDDPNVLFFPVRIDGKTIALRCKGNNRFCKRLTTDGKTSSLNANLPVITKEAQIEVAEIVVSRTIDNIEYRFKDARIYNHNIVTMAKGDAVNKTKGTDTVTFKFSYEDKKKWNWTNSVSAKVGVTTKFEASVPFIGKGKVEVSAEVGGGHTWGETHKKKKLLEFTHAVTVPPMTRVKIYALINTASCDVPFSYYQTDTLKNGKQVSHRYDDGVFTGVNSYGYEFKTQNLPFEE